MDLNEHYLHLLKEFHKLLNESKDILKDLIICRKNMGINHIKEMTEDDLEFYKMVKQYYEKD